MTPSEFKAWFHGFVEALEGTPSQAQWSRIKARVAEIDGRAITEHVYINRYLPSHPYPYWGAPYYGPNYIYCDATGAITLANATSGNATLNGSQATPTAAFDSHHAMLALGRAEALGIGNATGFAGSN